MPARDAITGGDHGGRWVFYYDGDCGFCTRVVRALEHLDLSDAVAWVPYQTLDDPLAGLSWDDLDRAAYLDTGKGRLRGGFYAFRMLTLRLVPLLPLPSSFGFRESASWAWPPIGWWRATATPYLGAGSASRRPPRAGRRNGVTQVHLTHSVRAVGRARQPMASVVTHV